MSKARQLADLGNQVDDGAITGSNLIINGAMQVAQRGTSVTGIAGGGYFALDRMKTQVSSGQSGTHTVSQSTDAPTGFYNSYKIECTTAQANPNQLRLMQAVEGYNVAHLGYNTATAKTLTLSFWVKSNLTGAYAISLETTTGGRYLNTSYTINAANTWEYKTIKIVGDTASPLDPANQIGLFVSLWLTASSALSNAGTPDAWISNGSYSSIADGHGVNMASSTSNYWQITGVCLNVGDSAIAFPHESYGETLAKCQRYYYEPDMELYGASYDASNGMLLIDFPAAMRATPTVGYTSRRPATSYDFSSYNGAARAQLYFVGGDADRPYVTGATFDAEL